jgi:hypothetical protein
VAGLVVRELKEPLFLELMEMLADDGPVSPLGYPEV